MGGGLGFRGLTLMGFEVWVLEIGVEGSGGLP